MSIKEVFELILSGYPESIVNNKAPKVFGTAFRDDLPSLIRKLEFVDDSYSVEGSVGQGNAARVPWVAVFDKTITRSVQKGEYIVYLLSADGKTLYLTFNQGSTKLREEIARKREGNANKKLVETLQNRAAKIRMIIDNNGFNEDDNIVIGREDYEAGTIYYKAYQRGNVPSDDEIINDLQKMVAIYKEYVKMGGERIFNESNGGMFKSDTDTKRQIKHICDYINYRGFTYSDGLIENYYLSLKTKPFVILAGTSGTGKTRLVRLFAEAICNNFDEQYLQVAVRPDWSDSSDLFGHSDLSGKFIPGTILEFIKKASGDKSNPYFLCLDEMNLARVEYYLSDFLSIIETRNKKDNGEITSDPLVDLNYYGNDNEARDKHGVITIPDNLYIVGTVNMDETTFPFSKKVLDRANTIEFSYVDLNAISNSQTPVDAIPQSNDFLKSKYVQLIDCKNNINQVEKYSSYLQKMNEILKEGDEQIGYRIRDEVIFYLLYNNEYGLLSENDALDNEIMQKILPRIKGSNYSIKKVMIELFNYLMESNINPNDNESSIKMIEILESSNKFSKTANKLVFMVRRFEEDGFTSYWF